MPKMTRDLFLHAVEDVWGGAQRNFAKDRVLHAHLVAFDSMARGRYFLHGDPDDPKLTARNIVGVPGPWSEHLPLLAAEFHAHRAVAAILVGEAWIGRGEVATEMVRMDLYPHEHPLKEEVAFVVGAWPREYLGHSRYAIIERDEHGQNPRLREALSFASGDGGAGVSVNLMASWLAEILPKPHR